MEFRILGPTEVLDGGRRLPLPSGRGRALLALLALHAGEPISADRLIDELWGEEPPPSARTVVHDLVSRLRRVLEPDKAPARPTARLETVGGGYRLAIEAHAVDAHRFKRLIDEAREAPAAEAGNDAVGGPGPLAGTGAGRLHVRAVCPARHHRTGGASDPGDRGSDRGGPRVGSCDGAGRGAGAAHPRPSLPRAPPRLTDACALPLRTAGSRPPGVPRCPLAARRGAGPRTRPRAA